MPEVEIDGIATHYETRGSGPALLMFAPGGFDATIEKWSTLGIYKEIGFLDHLEKDRTLILFDRRETGQSGGSIERVTWAHYATQGKGLLDHLGIARADLMGGCMGCSVAIAFGVAYPAATRSMVLFWPVGGAKYRMTGQSRFSTHLAFVQQNGLPAVVALSRESQATFSGDPRVGPWVSVIRRDPAFAERYAAFDAERYRLIVAGIARTLLDRDTAPGAEPEDLLNLKIPTLIVPGADASHATSAARYLEECIPGATYWDVAVGRQKSENAPARVRDFLAGVASPRRATSG